MATQFNTDLLYDRSQSAESNSSKLPSTPILNESALQRALTERLEDDTPSEPKTPVLNQTPENNSEQAMSQSPDLFFSKPRTLTLPLSESRAENAKPTKSPMSTSDFKLEQEDKVCGKKRALSPIVTNPNPVAMSPHSSSPLGFINGFGLNIGNKARASAFRPYQKSQSPSNSNRSSSNSTSPHQPPAKKQKI